MTHHERILDIILDKSEITWQSIIYDLVSSEQMDPWDVNVSLLTQKYIAMLKSLKEHDFSVSGKVVLAAAILLKIKSNRWVKEDIANLDALFHQADEPEDILDEFGDDFYRTTENVDAELIPRTPQPRKRKVSVYDLVNALEKALEVKHRRVLRDTPVLDFVIPKRSKDITSIIKEIYGKILGRFKKSETLTFSQLLESNKKEDRIYTFIPLLHLTNQRKINIDQKEHFGEIDISLHKPLKEPEASLEE